MEKKVRQSCTRPLSNEKSSGTEKVFDSGIAVFPHPSGTGFIYGEDVFGPQPENRTLDDIRGSLLEPHCAGPDIVYSIAMDVGKKNDRVRLHALHLLFGVVTYAAGKLGREPVRSQGHIHRISPFSGWSTPEVYEIWSGKAIIYMQETADDFPGRCFAVHAQPGDVVIVPPGWVHATVSACPEQPLTFGAWCDRAYGFVYDGVRRHRGIAWFPVYNDRNELEWQPNPHYRPSELVCKPPDDYATLGIRKGRPIYPAFEDDPELFRFVPEPARKATVWESFVP
ncbi:MAG: glucose-6-phosphate isomerase [Tannerella sp.]|jgi:glucose-6-phosphate isomerase|nr:glucose-6-phosphate isomerase [Tannerella sp.]